MFSSFVRSAGFQTKGCPRRRGGAQSMHGLRPVVQLEGRLVPATFTVTNVLDSGTGSLRQAIQSANAMSGADTISFFPNVTGTITLTSGELFISGAISILGPGADKLTVSGNFASRIFKINTQGSKSAVGIAGLTIANGFSDLNGGGIRSKDAALSLVDCVVTGNTSFIDGGGIFVYSAAGSLVVRRCSITNNSAPYGGGIDFFQGGGGSLVIEDTTLSGNSATGEPGFGIDGSGGGVYFSGTVGAGGLVIRNSTISGNTATGSGAGVCVANLVGNLLVQNSTITANINSHGTGGGIARLSGTGNIVLESTIVSGNSSPTALDLYTTGTVNATRCLIGSPLGVTNSMVDVTTNGLFGVDPQLGPLTNNGGLSQTHALAAGSPCIDVGSNPANMGYDQRGAGYSRTVGAAPDIGAYEYQTPPSPPGFSGEPFSVNGGNGQRSMVNQVTINFSQIVNLPANPASAFELKRQSDGAVVGLVASVVNTTATKVTLTFTGAMTQGGSLLDGRYTLKMFAAMISNGNGSLDGNGDGIGGDNFVLASSGTSGIFRLFGDADGNGVVNAADFVAFRNGYGLAGPSIFDVNNDGIVSAFDFHQFRLRYGVTI